MRVQELLPARESNMVSELELKKKSRLNVIDFFSFIVIGNF